MQEILKYIKKNRSLFQELIGSLSNEQINQIPEGFRNNIAWNYGHSIISTIGLCYKRSGINPSLEIPYGADYAKGSAPRHLIDAAEIKALTELSDKSIAEIEKDILDGKLTIITPFSTATYSFTMDKTEEVITCCAMHEALHYGYARAQSKALK